MTKDEFASRLRAQGYEAQNEDGCVMIISGNREDFDRIREIAEASGYAGMPGATDGGKQSDYWFVWFHGRPAGRRAVRDLYCGTADGRAVGG